MVPWRIQASRAEHDRLDSQRLGARAYMTNPVDAPQLIDVVESIADFGLTISTVSGRSLR